MAFDVSSFEDPQFQDSYLAWLVEHKSPEVAEHFGRLWDYYENRRFELRPDSHTGETNKRYVQAQEFGLPYRISGRIYRDTQSMASGENVPDIQRKEVVIENDIAWRVHAMVDFLFGKNVRLVSQSPQAEKRREIEEILAAVLRANGDIGFLQDMAVLGAVYGYVDCLLRPGPKLLNAVRKPRSLQEVLQLAQAIELELIEAPRALPILDEQDYRRIRYYVQHFYQQQNQVSETGGFLRRLLGRDSDAQRKVAAVTEIIGPHYWQRYQDQERIAEGENPLGRVPIVHIQNIAQPYMYEGVSDVEQLMTLQDELNTRLSDRASRITYQAFKMYLAKGIEPKAQKTITPGQIWYTHNPDATIETFGGDNTTPSEHAHIAEIREAMDKVSGVTPVVAGVLKGKIGNLTSAVAIKMLFMGMLSKTSRKQFTYGEGLKRIGELILHTLDACGVYRTSPQDRRLEVVFPNPLPEDTTEKLHEAQIKRELGVPQDQILDELGYRM